MKVYKELIVCKNTAVGLGFFDGVHMGHQALITELVRYSKSNNLTSVILTFKRSPAECFTKNVKYITTNMERNRLIADLGVDVLIELDFNEQLMNISHEDYLKEVLYKNLAPKAIFTGFNHTFGKGKKGTPMFLKSMEKEYGYKYFEISPIKNAENVVSSTFIKSLLSQGKVLEANNLLSGNFKISGKVIEGNKIGRTIGFPTANIEYPQKMAEIPFGVYASIVNVRGKAYKGVLNYGIKPSISESDRKPVAEVHILDFNQDIYNETIDILLVDKIRDEQKFESLEDLKQQIKEDIKRC